MAKAFYKKAQMAYENEDYEEAIDLITETKNNLNGNTNADIIYLEAKARYKNDRNINKAKRLFESFLDEADTDDGRIQEVANILVDIKTSDNFYDNGLRKMITGTFDDGRKYKKYLTECYVSTNTCKIVTEESEKYLGSIQHCVGGNLVFRENIKDGKINYQTFYKYHSLNGNLILSKYYENYLYEITYYPTDEEYRYREEKSFFEDISTFRTEIRDETLKTACKGENYSFNYVIPNEDHGFKYFDNDGNVTIHYMGPAIHIFGSNGVKVGTGNIYSQTSIQYYDKESNESIYSDFNMPLIKSIKTEWDGGNGLYHEIYHFDENGQLIKKDQYKRKKYKYSERFNKSDNSWTKI
ncbi:hypothetical protein KH5_23520 [Urechidicola sp. KH5]